MFSQNNDESTPSVPHNAAPQAITAPHSQMSVIASDLKISGDSMRMIAEHPLLIEGEIYGSVIGKIITIGQTGLVTGEIDADTVQINGRVNGTVRAGHVILSSTAQVLGDIHHATLTLEVGANFEGNVRRIENNEHGELKQQQSSTSPEAFAARQLQSNRPTQ